MQDITIQAIPNQEVSFQIEDETYRLQIKYIGNDSHIINIYRNDIEVINGQRILPFSLILPYEDLVTTGNFIFQTSNDELLDYNKFGISQFLVFATNEDLANV